MAYEPLTAESKQSGEHFVLHSSFRGPEKAFRFTWTLQPGKSGPGEHIHPAESHALRIVAGRLSVWLDGVRRECGAGDHLTIPAGVAHRFRNEGEVAVVAEISNDGASLEDFVVPFAIEVKKHGGQITPGMGAQMLVQLVATDPNIPVGSTVWLARMLRPMAWLFRAFGVKPLPPVVGWDARPT